MTDDDGYKDDDAGLFDVVIRVLCVISFCAMMIASTPLIFEGAGTQIFFEKIRDLLAKRLLRYKNEIN